MSLFNNWRSACSFLNEKIEKVRPLAGQNIIIEKTSSGYRISTRKNAVSGGGGSYSGFFKVCDISGGLGLENPQMLVGIVDGSVGGMEGLEYDAGIAYINNSKLDCPSGVLSPPGGVSYVVAEFYMSGNSPAFGGYSCVSYPENYRYDKIGIILATVETGDKSLRIIQQHHGAIYSYLFKEC